MHSIKVETKQYVSFNPDTGEIFAIGPSQEEGYQHIEVTEEQIDPIKTFKDKMEDYKVVFSSVTKQHELRKLENNEDENRFLLNQLQEKRKDPYFDIIFSVDKKKDLCYISTIEGLSNVKFDANIMFSVTKKDDPHFLIESVDYKVGDKLELEIKLDKPYSIFTDSNSLRCVYEEI
tara:strand:+ start:2899 stop:3426 length:528 start_codon:yes stop_codon:yes gene_type:complete